MDQTAIILINVLIGLCAGLSGIVGTLLLRKDDRQQNRGDKVEGMTQAHGIDLATLSANVTTLMGERPRCDALATQVAHVEAWQKIMGPRIDEAHEGLRAVARLDERMRTVFAKLDEISRKLPAGGAMAAA